MAQVGIDSYVLRMQEMVSGPLLKMQQQVERLTERMLKLEQTAQKVSRQLSLPNIDSGINLLTKAFSGLVGVMTFGLGIAQKFLGTVIEVSQFRTQNITALSTFLPGAGRGASVFNRALNVGGITPADEMEVVKQVKALAAAGYQGAGLNQANAALLDVHAMLGEENRGSLQYYFQKFIGGRKVEADDLRMASFSAGLQETDVMRRVLQNAGVKPASDPMAMGKQFDALKKGGKFTGRDVVRALLGGINERLDEGKGLGAAAVKQGEGTLAGLMSNLAGAPRRLLAQMELEKSPGIKALMDFIKRILVFFDKGSEQGKKLTATIEKMINVMLGGLAGITDEDLDRFFAGAIAAAEQMMEVLKKAWGWMDQLMHGNADAFLLATGQVLFDVGVMLGKGIWAGFWAAMNMGSRQESAADQEARHKALGRFGLAPTGTRAGVSNRTLRLVRGVEADAGTPLQIAQQREEFGPTAADIPAAAAAAAARSAPAPTVQIGTINLSGGATEEQARELADRVGQLLKQRGRVSGATAGR